VTEQLLLQCCSLAEFNLTVSWRSLLFRNFAWL
jgi:hypothetical protein